MTKWSLSQEFKAINVIHQGNPMREKRLFNKWFSNNWRSAWKNQKNLDSTEYYIQHQV